MALKEEALLLASMQTTVFHKIVKVAAESGFSTTFKTE